MQYKCPPLSRGRIRRYAMLIREQLKLNDTLYFPVEKFLEVLFGLIGDEDFDFILVSDDEWTQPDHVHAFYEPAANCIYIKESVYENACDGSGRDRMTIVHECAHVLLLKHNQLKLTRSFEENIPTYCDPEWQAKCLAGELMIPCNLVTGMTIAEVSKKCGVSYVAAKYQLSKYG